MQRMGFEGGRGVSYICTEGFAEIRDSGNGFEEVGLELLGKYWAFLLTEVLRPSASRLDHRNVAR